MRAAELIGTARVVFVGIGSTCRAVRPVPPRPRGADGGHGTACRSRACWERGRSGSSALGGAVLRDELTCVGAGRACGTLAPYRFDRRSSAQPGVSASLGHHRADGGGGRGPASGTRPDRARRPHRRRLEGRRSATPIVVGPPDRVTTLVTDPSAPAGRAANAAPGRCRGRDRRADGDRATVEASGPRAAPEGAVAGATR